jgi:transcriptional regulator with XRE-family HTH domain
LRFGYAAATPHKKAQKVRRKTNGDDEVMNDRQIFGAFLKEKRNERVITLRALAEMVGIKFGYYGDIETGRRTPLDLEFLDKIKEALSLSDADSAKLYDLAGKAREAAPPDLTGYINSTPKARVALRVAKATATDEDWERFIQDLEKKGR